MKKLIKKILTGIMLVVFILSLYNLYKIFSEYNNNKTTYKEVSNIVKSNEKFPIGSEEYANLKGINEDYLFWIFIPNTNINYPVVKPESNDEYLYKNFKGEENKGGSIFVDSRVALDDDNIIIHGHNMKDKSMFGTLSNLLKPEYLNDNKYIYIYLENKILQYEIFSTYVTNGEDFPYKSEFKDDEEFNNYIDTSISKSINNLNYFEDGKRNIITLSTCTSTTKDARTIVSAKLKDVKY